MILYFTTTGNSRYVAERIAESTADTCVNLFDRLKTADYSEINSDTPWVIVSPVYAYETPPIVTDWLRRAKLVGNRQIYFVLTCGAGICGAGYFNRKLAAAIGMEYMGTAHVVMPENYILMFRAPEREEALQVIEAAEPVISDVARMIKAGESLNGQTSLSKPGPHAANSRQSSGSTTANSRQSSGSTTANSRQSSGSITANFRQSDAPIRAFGSALIHGAFFGGVIRDKKFVVSDACIGCGKCARDCVKNNIVMVDGKPTWQGDCTHCVACICGCPQHAIEYGKATQKRVRYTCPK